MVKEKTYWAVSVQSAREQENGKFKRVTEKYLVSAVNPTDVETKIAEELKDDPFEWVVKSISETKILEVIE